MRCLSGSTSMAPCFKDGTDMLSPTPHLFYPLKATTFLAVALVIGGCSNLTAPNQDSASARKEECRCAENTNAEKVGKKPPNTSEQRRILNEGYSLLHTDASKLNLSELILYGKSESDQFEGVITDIANFAGKLEKDLERIAKDYPAVQIDLDPLPVMEKRKRWDIGKDRVIDFAPGVGRGGREYERTVLISLLNGINHERHMCKVMAKEEPEASLKKFLTDTEKGYDVFYDRIEAVLNKEYFRN
jgi:hypothetical protein